MATASPSRSRSPRLRGRAPPRCAQHVGDELVHLRLEGCHESVVVSKVYGTFRQSESGEQILAQRLDPVPERAVDLTLRLPTLGVRLRVDEVGQTLDGAEVHAIVEEGTARELTRLRGAATWYGRKCPQHGGHHRPAPVKLELRRVLACKRIRPGEP